MIVVSPFQIRISVICGICFSQRKLVLLILENSVGVMVDTGVYRGRKRWKC